MRSASPSHAADPERDTERFAGLIDVTGSLVRLADAEHQLCPARLVDRLDHLEGLRGHGVEAGRFLVGERCIRELRRLLGIRNGTVDVAARSRQSEVVRELGDRRLVVRASWSVRARARSCGAAGCVD